MGSDLSNRDDFRDFVNFNLHRLGGVSPGYGMRTFVIRSRRKVGGRWGLVPQSDMFSIVDYTPYRRRMRR